MLGRVGESNRFEIAQNILHKKGPSSKTSNFINDSFDLGEVQLDH